MALPLAHTSDDWRECEACQEYARRAIARIHSSALEDDDDPDLLVFEEYE